MNSSKLLHIHTDPKFLHDTLRYQHPGFYNHIVFLGTNNQQIQNKLENLSVDYTIFEINDETLQLLIEKTADYDGVVIYELWDFKVKYLEALPMQSKVILRFFGYELYKRVVNQYVSKKTLKYAYPITLEKYSLKNFIKRKVKRLLNREFYSDTEKQKKLYQKIDAILLVNQYEYEDLKKNFYLPEFIALPMNRAVEVKTFSKENKIIIGNSKNFWNNHLNVLTIINSVKNIDTQYVVFFNYGEDNLYTENVRQETAKNENIQLIEDFLIIDEFDEIYNNAAALVINSYRQHALGNIFTGILKGCKIYLNQRSSTYKWLIQHGFLISEIADLKADLKSNNIYLSPQEQVQNIGCYQQLQSEYTQEEFLIKIKKLLSHE